MGRLLQVSQVRAEVEVLASAYQIRLGLEGERLHGYPDLSPEEIRSAEGEAGLGASAVWVLRLPRILAPLDPCIDPASRSPFDPEIPDLLPLVSPEDLLPQLQPGPGRQLILLVQAGAAALGLWEGEDLLAHKAFRRYVTRGKGRAQPKHLRTRGKSRYGSRLRLLNARRQFLQTVEVVEDWREQFGEFEQIHYSVPVRLWGELRSALAEVLEETPRVRRLPLDLGRPCFAEVERVRHWCEHAEWIRSVPGDMED